jgi:hypothetical protein
LVSSIDFSCSGVGWSDMLCIQEKERNLKKKREIKKEVFVTRDFLLINKEGMASSLQ